MSKLGLLLSSLILAANLAGCSALPDSITIDFGGTHPKVDDIVQATFEAMTAAARADLSTPPPPGSTGSISGTLNYPSDMLPAMYVTAFQLGTPSYRYVVTTEGQRDYEISGLAPGSYNVVAYTVGGQAFPAGISGGYTQAVPCGLQESCRDHTLISIPVEAGQAITGINPADWQLVEGAFPPFPGNQELQDAATALPSVTTGSITGHIAYPASAIPALRIVAFQVPSGSYYFVDTSLGQDTYTIEDLPAAIYHVVAYVRPGGGFGAGPVGAYTQMVPCGLKFGCDDHSLIDVLVTARAITQGVDPSDFYADPGTFPTNPAP